MKFKKTILFLFVFGVYIGQVSGTQLFADFLSDVALSLEKGLDKKQFSSQLNNPKLICPEDNIERGKGENPGLEIGAGSITLDYQFPEKILSGSTFLLKCKISKGGLKGAVWMTQQLPVHFDVVEPKVANAETEYKGNTLNLMWSQVTNDSVIEISYTVTVNHSYGYLPISSVLYFGETGEEYFFDTHVLIDKVRPEDDFIAPDLAENDKCITFVALSNLSGRETKSIGCFEEKPQHDISGNKVYSIQIFALKYDCNNPYSLKERYNIDQEIIVDDSYNLRKYTIGKFNTVKEAYVYLKKMKDLGITEAFIIGLDDDNDFIGFTGSK